MTASDESVRREEATSGAVLTVDLAALRDNYRTLDRLSGNATCAAVIKADAYGIGATAAARALAAAGCGTFFVALPSEGAQVRQVLPEAAIHVLNGLFPGAAPEFERNGLIPVLGSLAEIEEWAAHCRTREKRLPAAIHVDTGITRLGLGPEDVDRLVDGSTLLGDFELSLVMSHLACADSPDHPMNARQRKRFDDMIARLPKVPASLANSGGVFNGPDYHYDLVRPGIALYGGRATVRPQSALKPVVHLGGRIMQTRTIDAGTSVGYGATWTAQRRSRIAVVSVGYADGYFRLLGGTTDRCRAFVCVDGRRAPVVGRVSMDMITVDVTDVPPEAAERGAYVELLGENIGVDELAEAADTIGYEILTSLGSRYARVYSGA